MKHYNTENSLTIPTLLSISCDACKTKFEAVPGLSEKFLSIKHSFPIGSKYHGKVFIADVCESCVERYFMGFLNLQDTVSAGIERSIAARIVNTANPKATVFKIYRDMSLQISEPFVQDGNKFLLDGKTYVVLEHVEQLQYVIDNLDYALKKILDFFPMRFIGRIAEMKDDFIKNNLQNIKGVLNNQIIYKIVSEAISIKGFPVFISPFPPDSDRKNWITISDKSYVIYRIQ